MATVPIASQIGRRPALCLALLSSIVFAAPSGAQTTAPAWPEIREELERDEQAAWDTLLSRLPFTQRAAMSGMILLRPIGERGMLAAKVLKATREQQAGLVTYLSDQTAAERERLDALLGSPDSDEWDAFLSGIAGYPRTPVVLPVRSVQVTNGTPAAPFSAPWQAQIFKAGASASPLTLLEARRERERYRRSLLDFERWHDCGAVLIAETWVLTAAHCIKQPRLGRFLDTRRVRTGTQSIIAGGTTWRIAAVVKHAGYGAAQRHDIALLKIAADAQTDRGANRQARATRLANLSDPPLRVGDPLLVTGWGVTQETPIGSKFLDGMGRAKRPSARLLEAELRNLPLEQCNSNPNLIKVGARVGPGQICAAGRANRDACQGDSGGPLVRRGRRGQAQLVGLVSYGAGCGLDDTPGVYVDVRHYRGWIQGAMKHARDGQVISWSESAPRRAAPLRN